MTEPQHTESGSRLSPKVLARRIALCLGIFVVLALLAQAVRVPELTWSGEYGWTGTPAPPLAQGTALGQTLELEQDHLSYLGLHFGTYGNTAKGEIELLLLKGAGPPKGPGDLGQRLLASTRVKASDLQDNAEWRWEPGALHLPDRTCHLLIRKPQGTADPATVWLDKARDFTGPKADILDTRQDNWTSTKAAGHVSLSLGFQGHPRLLTYLAGLTRWGGWALTLFALAGFYLIVLFNWRKNGLNLALTCGSILFTLLALESGLRVVQGQLFTFDNFLYQDLDLFHSAYPAQFDDHLGFIPKIGYASEGDDNLWKKRIHILDRGIRSNGRPAGKGRELPEKPLILCVGDSFTFGAQVHDEETWPAYLEQGLGIRAVNAGVFGFGLDQSVMRAEQLIPVYKPDLLIVGLIQDDILRNRLKMRTGVFKPYFTIQGDHLVLHKVPLKRPAKTIGPERRIGGYSLLIHTLMLRINKNYWLHGLDKLNFLKRVETAHGQGVEVSCRLFQRLAGLSRKSGLEVIVFFQYVKDETKNRFLKIQPCVDKAGLTLVDLKGPLDQTAESDPAGYEALFEGHMTAAGNRLAADSLIGRIREKGLLPGLPQ